MSTPDFFSGKKTLITGGSKRLGKETALALARLGSDVAIHYNSSRAPAEALCLELEELGVRGVSLAADLNDPEQVTPLFSAARESLGGVDFLVNNASIFPTGRLDEMELPELHRNLRVNTWAPFLLIRAFWRTLKETGGEGAVVNLLDTRLVGGDLAHVPYHMSKAALREVTLLSALEFAPELRINGVAPGAVLPPEDLGEDHLDRLTAELPLRRRGFPKDIADATLYLLGATFVTGQVIFVDGGRHIRLGGST